MIVIADSSFLIALATVDALGLLPKIFPMITIPDAVNDEVAKKGAGLPGSKEVADATWIRQISVRSADKVKAYRAERLGIGEAEVLALAEELKADMVLMDDERAWDIACQKRLRYLRSVEFLLEGHRRRHLDAATVTAKLMLLWGKRWIGEEVITAALEQLR